MPDEFVIEDDPTEKTDDQLADVSGQDTPPEEPAARAAYFENKFKEENLASRGLAADKKRLEGIVEDERTSKKTWKEMADAARAELAGRPIQSDAKEKDGEANEDEEILGQELAVGVTSGMTIGDLVKLAEQRTDRKYKNYVKPEDVEAAIDRRLNTIVAQGRLAEKYDDLADPESEFTKKVNVRTVQLAKEPECEGMSQIALMRLAAAEIESESGGRAKERGNGETDRETRVGRQSVQGGAPRKTGKVSTELSDQQRKFAKIAGITEKEYADNATIRTYPTLGPQ